MSEKQYETAFEIIKTAVLVVGLALAIYELVLRDRDTERTRANLSLDLIRQDVSSDMINAKERFFREYYTRYVKDGNMTLEDAVEIEATLSPILNYFVTWEACFEAGLCDVQAGLKFVCERANAHQQIIEQTSSVIDYEPGEILNQYYSSLLKRCFNN